MKEIKRGVSHISNKPNIKKSVYSSSLICVVEVEGGKQFKRGVRQEAADIDIV